MFTGIYQHAIDAKGRTSLPSKFRELLSAEGAEKLHVTMHPTDPCLMAFSPAAWEASVLAKLRGASMFDPAVTAFQRMFVSPAQECSVDKLGRVLIPPSLREFAGLGEEITWSGAVNRIEIWAPARWAEEQKRVRAPEMQPELMKRLPTIL